MYNNAANFTHKGNVAKTQNIGFLLNETKFIFKTTIFDGFGDRI